MRHTRHALRPSLLASGLAVFGAATVCWGSVAGAAPATHSAKMSGSAKARAKSSKVIDVPFCAMDQMAMSNGHGAAQIVGKHRLHFCNIAERKQFNALPAAQRQQKVAAVLKLQQSKT